MAPKIQISIQGGGAKFVNLLPAVDAALQVHNDKILTISRVSGSSAGAIAAALIAAKADFSKLEQVLADSKLQTLVGSLNSRLDEIADSGRLSRWGGTYNLLRDTLQGLPVEDIQKLRSVLEHIFMGLCGFIPSDFTDLKERTGIELLITSSDIINQRGRVVSSGSVVDAILNSSALPFFYRNFKDLASNPVVDGGVCDNLPVQYLMAGKATYGEIFAICLSEQGAIGGTGYPVPSNVFSYAWAIWSAVQNDAIRRTRELLNSAHLIDIKTDIKLTDFRIALQSLRSTEKYGFIKEEALVKFLDFAKLQSYGDISEKVTVSGHIDTKEMMNAVFKMYKSAFDRHEYQIERSSYVIRADCLDKISSTKSRRADQITREIIIRLPKDKNAAKVTCIRSFIDIDRGGAYCTTRWSVEFIKSRRKIRPIVIPADDLDSNPPKAIDCLLFFEEPLVGSSQDGYKIRISSHYAKQEIMLPLEQKGSDFISIRNSQNIAFKRLDIILCTPKSFGQITVSSDPSRSNVEKGGPVRDPTMIDDYRFLQSADYNVFGYSAADVKPGEKVGARFTRAYD
ncbi:patatin-like phospholipase family protein [Mesorhizobium sp. M0815]|uniref:patatin-like phospholipase family protein n=1 Tax=Mesorhizobium sp. M0815 TaxID=2957005 RepID=UPI003334EE46